MELIINVFRNIFTKVDNLQVFGNDILLLVLLIVGLVFCYGGFIIFRFSFWLIGGFAGGFYGSSYGNTELAQIFYSLLGGFFGVGVFAFISRFAAAFMGVPFGFMIGYEIGGNMGIFICVLISAVVAVKLIYPFMVIASSYIGSVLLSFIVVNFQSFFANGQLTWHSGIAYYGSDLLKQLISLFSLKANIAYITIEFWAFLLAFISGMIIQTYFYFKYFREEDINYSDDW